MNEQSTGYPPLAWSEFVQGCLRQTCVWRVFTFGMVMLAGMISQTAAAETTFMPGERHSLAGNDCLPAPKGAVVLTIKGAVICGNAGTVDLPQAHFDMDMLDALPSRVMATHTPWTQGRVTFTGPLVRELIHRVAGNVTLLTVSALNDFSADIPISDIEDYDVLLATQRDGQRMAVRDLGPLFILYPFDAHPELLNEQVRFRSVWQVNELSLK
ncbi:hypothetical protein [Cobetia crustatorum]|uniref:hypothetical protein n=1 Tax=Cobetia crustatorum TaxID=553385 RepID=UPI000468B2DE|nr:hypothetical protein [Cobetia crustatorum]